MKFGPIIGYPVLNVRLYISISRQMQEYYFELGEDQIVTY